MRLATITVLTLAVAAAAAAVPTPAALGWALHPTPPAIPQTVRVRLHLVPPPACSRSAIAALATAVSDPFSQSYGAFLTQEALAERCWPEAAVVAAVADAVGVGVGDLELAPLGDAVYADVDVRVVVEGKWGASMAWWVRGGSEIVLRSHVPVGVPAALADVVTWVAGLDEFPPPRTRLADGKNPFPGVSVTPATITTLYGVTYGSTVPANVSQAVAEFEEAYFYPADLATFLADNKLPPAATPTIVGENKPQKGYLGECSLDIEFIVGLARGVDTWMFSVKAFDLVEWANTVLATAARNPGNVPTVQSISWGSGEQSFPQAQLAQTDDAFTKMALLGYTLLCASGDDGTGKTGTFSCDAFSPTFPATLPFCTSVGATFYEPSNSPPEQAVSFSGGGFSTVFARPAWQDAAVAAYFASGTQLPDAKYYNASGAAVPDIAAIGTNFEVVIQNCTGPISGTSAATPTIAALMSLINAHRVAAGKPRLGHVAPLLYAIGDVGTDIVVGDNKVAFCDRGFKAAPHWDPISGLGSPLFATLLRGLA